MPSRSFHRTTTRVLTRVGALLCASVFALGCVPSLHENPPRDVARDLPSSYGLSPTPASSAAPQVESSGQKEWHRFFVDPDLQQLIEIALANNQELNIQLQDLIIAKNEIRWRRGEYFPKVEAGLDAGIEKVGEHTSQGVSDEAHDVAANLQDYAFGFIASWEIDVWRKLRNAADAASHRYLSSVEGRNFMVTQLAAEIANSYYELLALDNQIEVLKRNIEIQQNALEVVRLQKEAAQVTQLAVQRFEAEVLKNQSRQYDLEQKRIETENRINFLVGRFPQPVARHARRFREPLPADIQTGIPPQLLDNRPDLRQAEQRLAAAQLDVQVAKAEFFPKLSIAAGVGFEAFNLKHLVMAPESLAYNAAANLAMPIINREAIKAEYFSANAEQISAVLEYERAILRAFTEVANLVAMIDNLQKSYDLQSRQVRVLEDSIDVSNVLFQSARADYMEVLLTRRDTLDAEMELIETRRRQLGAMVDMYQALGGGWRQEPADLPTEAQPADGTADSLSS